MSGRDWLRKKSSLPSSRTSFPNPRGQRRFKVPQARKNLVQLSPEQLKNLASFGYNAFKLPVNVQEEPSTTDDITGNEAESEPSLDGSVNEQASLPLPDDTTAAQPEIEAIEVPAPASGEVSQIQQMSDTDGDEAQQLQEKSESEITENQSETLDTEKEGKPSAYPAANFIDIPVYTANSQIGIQPKLTPFRLENESQHEDESGISAQSNLEETIQQKRGSGDALSDDVRQPMESAFGADFSGVKVHTDSTSDKLNKSIQAKAFTTGKDIFFKQGEYQPQNQEGQELIAHELTHVVQQTGAIQPKSIRKLARKENKLQAKKLYATEKQIIQRKENPQPATPSSTAKSGNIASPQNDPAFKIVVDRAKKVAQQEKNHPPAGQKSAEAQAAAIPPANEVTSKAQHRQVEEINQQQPGKFNAAAFKAALMEKIAAVTPQTLEEADNFKNNNKINSVKGDLSSQVTAEKKQAADSIENKTKESPNTSGIPAKPVTPLPPNQIGSPTSDIGASAAAPKPKSEAEVSLQAGSQSLDKQMTDAKVTEEQLAKSNEPQFQGALAAKNTAETQANTAPTAYRQEEKATLTQAQGEAQTTAQNQLQGMDGNRAQLLTQIVGIQGQTKGQDEGKRAEVANHIQGIYNKTKQTVEKSLGELDKQVNQEFDQGAAAAKTEFENYVTQRMDAYKEERYSGVLGKGKWVKDKLFGMPSEVNAFYQEGKKQYLASMGKTIDKIANLVANKLNTAKAEIAKGKQDIQKYVTSLPQNLRQVGQEAAQNIQGQFDELEQSVDNKQNELVDSLAQKYNENLQAIDAKIEEMKAENRGLVDKATDAIAGTIKTIMQLKDMLMGVLAKAASAVANIIKDPIGFLGNLVSGIKQGFDNFVGNIITHLQTGLMGWLTGAMGALGLQLPEDIFSLQGIFSLVTQILGTTWNYIRMKAVKMFGEPIVKGMEKTVEIFQIIANKGPMGLWEHVQEHFGDLKETVIEEIKGMLITQVITAGVKWIIGLLNPASAFVKAAMAIYDIVMFFVNQGSQVVELVSAITDAVVAIASGAVGGAAKLVENALAKSLPVVIGFLASLLGIGDLAKKVQGIVGKIRQRIDLAIDKVLQKAKSLFKGKKGKGNKEDQEGKPDERTKDEKEADLKKALGEADTLLKGQNLSSDEVKKHLPDIKLKYDLTSLELVVDKESSKTETVHIKGVINPEGETPKRDLMRETKYIKDGMLKEQYRSKDKIRKRFYGSNKPYSAEAIERRNQLLTKYQVDKDNWKDPISGKVVPKSDVTIEHAPSVMSHWNDTGYNTDQPTRRNWFTFAGRLDELKIMSRSQNSSDGAKSKMEGEYRFDIGEKFKGPDERD
ncbi:eCIS core domain-containing protein [Limnofasciculus baicalensis]|uniref:DUF4157 domain-containing protein n=1 Tax=Limnofasciculus baicalensis BBK-W-15 TaxID=2699891 RepID=A0AAE3GR72_9CYAN|nr:DUF4157 domain-containing protein [Limnofasciculus baicalensis]MCP2729206.1 DUF4157 domain-containing protein [Limnofasciculus baicalensis BBK-W-15]